MRWVVGVIVVALALPQAAAAQGPSESWNNLDQLRVGQEIEALRMHQYGGLTRLKGTFLGSSPDLLTLRVKQASVIVPRDQVLQVTGE
jgi:hypothetical protein